MLTASGPSWLMIVGAVLGRFSCAKVEHRACSKGINALELGTAWVSVSSYQAGEFGENVNIERCY